MKLLKILILFFLFLTPTFWAEVNLSYEEKIDLFLEQIEYSNNSDIIKLYKYRKIEKTLKKIKINEKNKEKIHIFKYKNWEKIDKYDFRIKKTNFKRIAHAGWIYNWDIYTNSIDALENNKKYFNYFELDFSWTSDNNIVCIHDWEWAFVKNFWVNLNWLIPDYSTFNKYVQNNIKYKNCTLDSLTKWLDNNKYTYIITDIKSKNIEALKYIVEKYPNYIDRFIPQIYDPINYDLVKKMWYKNIIWTLYKYWESNDTVLYYSKKMNLFAVVMPKERAESGLGILLKLNNSYNYVHTINSLEELVKFKKLWINEVYTDSLLKY